MTGALLGIVLAAEEHGGQEAHHPILPETKEIVWGGLAFAILAALIIWKGLPAMRRALAARTARIEADLAAADRARSEAEAALAGLQSRLAGSRDEGARIVEEARQAADAMDRDAAVRLEDELRELRSRSGEDVSGSRARIEAELQAEAVSLAMGAAERIVRAQLASDGTQSTMVDEFISRVGAGTDGAGARVARGTA